MPWNHWETFRTYFDEVASDYDRLRPAYPCELFEWLVAEADLAPPAPLLDVGAGTGFCSLPLASQSFPVIAVEQSHSMCELLRSRAVAAQDYQILESRFEDAYFDQAQFSLVVCGTAFHWLDPQIRVAILRRVIKNAGWLCLAWHMFNEDAPCLMIRHCLDESCPKLEVERSPAHNPLEICRDIVEEVENNGRFSLRATKDWPLHRFYGPIDIFRLLLTYTGIRALPHNEILSLQSRIMREAGTGLQISFRVKAFLFRAQGP